MTRFTPNGDQDYVPLFHPGRPSRPVRWPSTTRTTCRVSGSHNSSSPPNPGSLCDSQPTRGLRCNDQALQWAAFSGTRSRHPGGVNTLFGGGSVHFIKNSISPMTWVQLGSINGGEVIVARIRIDQSWAHVGKAVLALLRPTRSTSEGSPFAARICGNRRWRFGLVSSRLGMSRLRAVSFPRFAGRCLCRAFPGGAREAPAKPAWFESG